MNHAINIHAHVADLGLETLDLGPDGARLLTFLTYCLPCLLVSGLWLTSQRIRKVVDISGSMCQGTRVREGMVLRLIAKSAKGCTRCSDFLVTVAWKFSQDLVYQW